MAARSKRQREILNFIAEFIETKGYSPSYQEIASGLGLASKGAVARHIESLESAGLLSRTRDEAGFALTLNSTLSSGCRHFQIRWHETSGSSVIERSPPVLTEEQLGLFDAERLVAFEVEDDAMSEDGILGNDVLFVELRSLATEGEVVLVEIDGTPLVRSYSRSGNLVTLSCSNPRFEEITASFSKVTVIGIVRGLLRPMS
jgi:repressor LexA